MWNDEIHSPDLQCCIPSIVDGLKPGQRMILFCSFEDNFIKGSSVQDLALYASRHLACPPRVAATSLVDTTIGMAQNFVGSNNINLLQPRGHFGTRGQGGENHGSAWYIWTCLSPITRYLFPKEDHDIFLEYSKSVEPTWYVPVIPIVLVNGSESIVAKGSDESTAELLSTFIPSYNPRDIVDNLKRLLSGRQSESMDPWYRGFDGDIQMTSKGVYTVSGSFELVDNTLWITELPVGSWTKEYVRFLESMKEAGKHEAMKDYIVHFHGTIVLIEVILSEDMMTDSKEVILEKFKLKETIKTDNMRLFDKNGAIRKYDNPQEILLDFYTIRLDLYTRRKDKLVEKLDLQIKKLENKVKFIKIVMEGEITVFDKSLKELCLELECRQFLAFPVRSKPEENEDQIRARNYQYLLSLCLGGLNEIILQRLREEKEKLEDQLEELKRKTVESFWEKDLEDLERVLDEQEHNDVEEKKQREMRQRKVIEEAGINAGKEASTSVPGRSGTN